MTGAELLVEALRVAGVDRLFSLSGNQILSIYDATIGRGVGIVHTRHEAAAVHMADGWGRMTERPGVALVTAGPGHLNAIGALYTALMSESPVVLLSGHSPHAQLGRGAFQEVDQVAVARPVVKAAWRVEAADRMGTDMARALTIAASGRPGPVHLSLPGDLLEARVPDGPAVVLPSPGAVPLYEAELGRIVTALVDASRPLIIVGPSMGRGRRWELVQRLSEATGIPALLMESPRGVNDPALHAAVGAVASADTVLLLGKRPDFSLRFGEPPAFAADSALFLVDAEAARWAGHPRIATAVETEPSVAAQELLELARTRPWPKSGWRDEVMSARAAEPSDWAAHRRATQGPIHPLRVCAAVQPWLDRGGVLVADGGEFGQWVQAGCEATTRLINGPAGSIGSAMPMAMGAGLAAPGRAVFALLGDGTFGFHAMELDTAMRHDIPFVAVVGNDARWNAEHQLQLQGYGAARAVGCELTPARYDLIATALGGHGELVERPDELEPALARAVASRLPACINVAIDGVAAPTWRAGRPAD